MFQLCVWNVLINWQLPRRALHMYEKLKKCFLTPQKWEISYTLCPSITVLSHFCDKWGGGVNWGESFSTKHIWCASLGCRYLWFANQDGDFWTTATASKDSQPDACLCSKPRTFSVSVCRYTHMLWDDYQEAVTVGLYTSVHK